MSCLNLKTNRWQALDMDVIFSFLGMRGWPRPPHSPRVHAFQTFERLAQRVQAVQAFRCEDEHAAVLLVFLGQRHFVVVRLITVEQCLRVSIDFTRSIGTFALSDQAAIALLRDLCGSVGIGQLDTTVRVFRREFAQRFEHYARWRTVPSLPSMIAAVSGSSSRK